MPDRRAVAAASVLFLALAGSGCQAAKRVIRPVMVLRQDPQEEVFSSLVRADGDGENARWDFEMPHRLRPCCAFGSDLGVRVGAVPIAGVHLDNVVQANDLGRHKYNSGLVSLANEPSNAFISPERNGLVFTCRGSFVDTAHVRDYADYMVYLAGRINESIDDGASIQLPSEGGERYMHVAVVRPELIRDVGRQELVIAMAQWASMQIAIWHEIATWYGWSSWELFPETASAFSPEDLYSNLVGIMLASELIREGLTDTVLQYEASMDAALPEVLRRLRGAPTDVTRAGIRALDGRWWDSKRQLPDKRVVLRRNFNVGPNFAPWFPPAATAPGTDADIVENYCRRRSHDVLDLRYPTEVGGEPLRYLVRIEAQPAPPLAQLLREHKNDAGWVSQEDFPSIVRRARLENTGQFGLESDRP